jgi:hypothetical protein
MVERPFERQDGRSSGQPALAEYAWLLFTFMARMSTDDLKILCVAKQLVYASQCDFADWGKRARFEFESAAGLKK